MSVAKYSGIVALAKVNPLTGVPKTGFYDVGEVDALEFGFNASRIEKYSKRDCNNGLIASLENQIDTNFSITLAEPTKKNLEAMFRGTAPSVASATVTDEPLHEGVLVVAGDYLYTKRPFTTLTNVKDSAGSPATLVLNTDYEVTDQKTGKIKILSVGSYTQPFKATYVSTAYEPVPFLNASAEYYWLTLSGVNCASLEKVRIDLYKIQINPIAQFAVLADQFNAFQLPGKMFSDATKNADAKYSELGNYGRIWHLS